MVWFHRLRDKIIVSKGKFLSNPCFFRKQGFFVASNKFTLLRS